MKTFPVVTLCVLLAVVVGVVAARGDVEEGEKGAARPTVMVHLKHTEPRTIATMRHTGSFNAIPPVIGKLMGEITSGGHLVAGTVMTVFYSDPGQVAEEELVWEVWVPVARPGTFGGAEDDEMGFKYLDVMFVAYTYHIGPYENVAQSYDLLFRWAARNQYKIVGPPVEVYWSDPVETPPEQLVTEIWLPVEEKKIPGGVVR
jgi:AraC family transcriptional regulator